MEPKEDKKEDKKEIKISFTKRALFLLILGILFVIIAPYLFTQDVGFLSFGSPNEIGDTIGGITAPITSLIGSILVYFAFLAQVNANKEIQRQIDRERDERREDIDRNNIQSLYNQLSIDISSFNFQKNNINYLGVEGIFQSVQNSTVSGGYNAESHDTERYPKAVHFYQIFGILGDWINLYETIEDSTLTSDQKFFFSKRLALMQSTKIYPAFSDFLKKNEKVNDDKICKACGYKHPYIPGFLFNYLIQIDKYSKKTSQLDENNEPLKA